MIKDNAHYISVRDLAELIDVGPKTIRREINRGELEAIKVGMIYRIHKEDALAWLEKKEYIVEDRNESNK